MEIWYKICGILFFLSKYNIYFCSQSETLLEVYNT